MWACSGRGVCYPASGRCDCYTGYTGDKCEKCASGWIRFGHRCSKLNIPYGVSTKRTAASWTDGAPRLADRKMRICIISTGGEHRK